MRSRVLCTVVGLMLLSGCGAIRDSFTGPARYFYVPDQGAPENPRLARILYNVEDTPGHQGYLYIAMVEAQIASQYAGYALVGEDLATVKNAIGDVVFAIDPTAAPSWGARSAGIVEGWAGKGYGVRRAVRNMQGEVRALAADRAGSGPIAEDARRVAVCTEAMLARADRIVALGGQVLAADEVEGLKPVLEQIDELARELYYGRANLETDRQALTRCGLQEAWLLLNAMTTTTA